MDKGLFVIVEEQRDLEDDKDQVGHAVGDEILPASEVRRCQPHLNEKKIEHDAQRQSVFHPFSLIDEQQSHDDLNKFLSQVSERTRHPGDLRVYGFLCLWNYSDCEIIRIPKIKEIHLTV